MQLLNFFKTITLLLTTVATNISLTTFSATDIDYARAPTVTANEYQSQATAKLEPVPERTLDPQSVIGILCTFVNTNNESQDYQLKKYQRGTGVIINVDGFVLANRNVTDPGFYDPETWQDYQFEGCQGGPAPKEYHLPTVDEIKAISPYIQVPVLSYMLEPVFAPYEVDLSDYENEWLDFSLFLITDLTPDAKFFGITQLPKKFPHTPILISEVPATDENIVSFGYPLGTTKGLRASITTLFIQGLLSHVTGLWTGDIRFKDELFLIQSKLDTEGTAEGGRVGSPILYKGYLVGIHIQKEDRSLNIYNLGIQPIVDILESNGITMFDEVY